MNKTINQLEELQEANSSDELVMYDVSTGTTQKISKKNFLTGTQDFYISASSAVVTGIDLFEGLILKIMFTSAISGTDTETALTISYNDVSYNVKVGKQGALANVYAHEVDTDTYTYIQAYTTLELQFDGTQFIILGNPVVLSSDNYTIYADGLIEQIFQGDGVALRTFPVAFNTTDYYGYIFEKQPNYNDYPQFLGYGSKATNQAQLYRAYHDGSGSGHFNVAIGSSFWVKLMGY